MIARSTTIEAAVVVENTTPGRPAGSPVTAAVSSVTTLPAGTESWVSFWNAALIGTPRNTAWMSTSLLEPL